MPNAPHTGTRLRRLLALRDLILAEPERWRRCDLQTRFTMSARQLDKDLSLLRALAVGATLCHSRHGYYYARTEDVDRLRAALRRRKGDGRREEAMADQGMES